MFGSGRNITLHSNGVLVLQTRSLRLSNLQWLLFNRTKQFVHFLLGECRFYYVKVFVCTKLIKLCRNKTRWPCRHESMGLKIRRSFYNKRNERASLKSVTHVELLHVGGRFASHIRPPTVSLRQVDQPRENKEPLGSFSCQMTTV